MGPWDESVIIFEHVRQKMEYKKNINILTCEILKNAGLLKA
jgi:hypothetical protein